jgi:hypothetical protein
LSFDAEQLSDEATRLLRSTPRRFLLLLEDSRSR